MSANERTSLLHAQQNGNGVLRKKDKLIIPMPKDPIFAFEDYWGGLSLEELLPYQNDPWWQKLRATILCSFLLMVILTFVTACVMAYFHSGSCKIINPLTTTSSVVLTDPIATTTIISELMSSSSSSKITLAP